MLPTNDADAADVTKCSTTTPSSRTAIWVYLAPSCGGSVRTLSWTTITRSTASRRARNSASLRIGGGRAPPPRPPRRPWRLRSPRGGPPTPLHPLHLSAASPFPPRASPPPPPHRLLRPP